MRILLRDLSPNTSYKLQLRAVGADGNVSDWSQLFPMTTTGDTVAPKVPTNVANTVSGTAFKFTWDAVTQSADNTPAHDLNGYLVFVSSPNNANTRVYETSATKMDFSFENNVAVFGTPQAAVRVQVAAIDANGNVSAYSSQVLATNPAPSAVTGLTGAVQPDGINLKWNANTTDADLKYYEVQLSTNGASGTYTKVWSGNSTSYVHPSTLYGVDHFFRVFSVDVFNTLSTAAQTTALRPSSPLSVDTTAPGIPANLAATLTNATDGRSAKAAVTWDAVTDTDNDLAEYIVDYKPSTETAWNTVKVDYEKTAVTILGLLPYTNYDFRIRASDYSANLSGWSTTLTKTATTNTAPATTTGVAISPGRDAVTISWTANSEPDVANGAGTYLIDLSTSATFASNVTTYRTGATSITVTGLNTDTPYYARVKAVDSLGLSSTNWSSTANGTTSSFPGTPLSDGAVPTGAPTLTASDGIGYIYLNWTPVANPDPVVYDVYMSTSSGFTTYDNTTKITEVSGTSAMIDTTVSGTSLSYTTPYYFRVRARDRDGSSASISGQASSTPKRVNAADSVLNDAKNLVVSGTGELGGLYGAWQGITGINFENVDKPAEIAGVVRSDSGTGTKAPTTPISEYGWDTTVGEQFLVEIWLKSDLPNSRIYVEMRDQAGAHACTFSAVPGENDGRNGGTAYPVGNLVVPTTWTKYVAIGTVTGTTTKMRLSSIYFNHPAGTERNAQQSIAVRVRRRSSGNLVLEGTLSANALAANTALINTLFVGNGGAVQSTNFNATDGFQLSETGLTIRGVGNAVDVAAVTAGTISAKTWNVGAGGIINIDSTGQIKSNNYALNSTGYRLSNTGLEINDGSVDAKALKTNTAIIGDLTIGRSADALGTLKSFDHSAGTAGWKIGKGVFEVNEGAIQAKALRIQTGQNLMLPEYANFEFVPSFYTGKVATSGASLTVKTGGGYRGDQFIEFRSTTTSTSFGFFGPSGTNYYFPLEEGKTYIMSAYVRGGTITSNAYVRMKYSNGTYSASQGIGSLAAGAPWQRISAVFTVPAGVTSGIPLVYMTTPTIGAGFDVDCVQIEEALSGETAPSVWTPPGVTSIDGAIIRTGEMRSNSNVVVNGSSQPAWSINLSGNAQFGDALVRGKILVGQSTDTDAGQSFISSGNFLTGVRGWKLDSSGALEANSGVFRGTLSGGIITGSEMYGGIIATSAAADVNKIYMDSTGFQTYQGTVENMIENPRMKGSTSTTSQPGYSNPNAGVTVTAHPVAGVMPDKYLRVNPSVPTSNVARVRYTAPALVLQPNTAYVFQAMVAVYNPTASATASPYDKFGVSLKRDDVRIIEGTTGRVIAMQDTDGWGGEGVGPEDYKYNQYPFDNDVATGYSVPTPDQLSNPSLIFRFTTPSDWNSQPVIIELPGNMYARNATTKTYAVKSDARVAYTNLMLEKNVVGSDYFDGSYLGATWNGTADASRSRKAGGVRTKIPVEVNDYFSIEDIDNLAFSMSTVDKHSYINGYDRLALVAGGDKNGISLYGTNSIDLDTKRTFITQKENGGIEQAYVGIRASGLDSAYSSTYLYDDRISIRSKKTNYESSVYMTTQGTSPYIVTTATDDVLGKQSSVSVSPDSLTVTSGNGTNYPEFKVSAATGISATSNANTMTIDSNGVRTTSKWVDLVMASGWAAYSASFNRPRAMRTTDGGWILSGLIVRQGTTASIPTTGLAVATIPGFSMGATEITSVPANSLNSSAMAFQVSSSGALAVRAISGAALSLPVGGFISLGGIVLHEQAAY